MKNLRQFDFVMSTEAGKVFSLGIEGGACKLFVFSVFVSFVLHLFAMLEQYDVEELLTKPVDLKSGSFGK